jgi:DNA-binding transcriptional MocR family regulator
MAIALETLEKHLPHSCEVVVKPNGGYFVFVTLPMTINSEVACKHLKRHHNMIVNDGRQSWTSDKGEDDIEFPMCNGIRISIPYLEEEHLRLAIKQFCIGISELCPEQVNGTQRG